MGKTRGRRDRDATCEETKTLLTGTLPGEENPRSGPTLPHRFSRWSRYQRMARLAHDWFLRAHEPCVRDDLRVLQLVLLPGHGCPRPEAPPLGGRQGEEEQSLRSAVRGLRHDLRTEDHQ